MVVWTYTGALPDGSLQYYDGVAPRSLTQADYDALTPAQQAQVSAGIIYQHV